MRRAPRFFWQATAVLCGWLAAASAAAAGWSDVYAQLGHANTVFAVAFSPDGRMLASGSADTTIKLWDLASGRELRTLRGHENAVYALAFSPDGHTLASAGLDQRVRLWDVASGRELEKGQWKIHLSAVYSLAFSPDGHTLASAGNDRLVKLWDVPSVDEPRPRTLTGHAMGVVAVAYSPDGRTLASGSLDNGIKLWDAASGRELRTLAGHTGTVASVAFSPDGRWLASAGLDHTIKLWAVASGRELLTLNGHGGVVFSVAFSADGRTLASASSDRSVRLWDVAGGTELRAFGANSNFVHSVAFSPDARTLASGNDDHSIKLWDLAGGGAPRTLNGHSGAVLCVALSPDSRTLASASADHSIKLWDLGQGRESRTLSGHTDAVRTVAFSSDARTLASGSIDHSVKLWDVGSGRELRTLSGHTDAVNSVAFSPDARTLASASSDHSVKLWDVASGRELRTFNGHSDRVNAIAFSPDGRLLASVGDDRNIRVWDVSTGMQLKALPHTAGIASVAFSPDGRTLAAGANNDLILFWQVSQIGPSSGTALRELSGHAGLVGSVAFSPDGRSLASGAWDNTVKLWDFPSARLRVSAIALGDAAVLEITPQGYYDYQGSTAEQNLLVRTGPGLFDVTDISAYREKFYRPDLLRLSLTGQDFPDNLATLASIKSAPDVTVQSPPAQIDSNTLSLRVSITDRGGGIGDVRVFINGSAVSQTDSRGLSVVASRANVASSANGASSANLTASPAVSRSIPLLMVPGRNEISVIAYNADGSMHSNPATASVTANYTAQRKPQLHALVVGINQFRNPAFQLKYSVADATAVAQLLQRRAAPLFDKVNVELLTTPESTTREALLAALGRYRRIAADDVFVFYVASHGTVEDEDLSSREYFLISSNVGLASDEALRRDAISQADLKQLIASIPATKKILLLDTCQAGALGDALALTTRGDSDQRAVNILSGAVGSTVLSAATSQEQALEGMDGHGVFTWVLLQGLDGKADVQKNGYVSTLDLASYVGDQVPKVADQVFKREQFPNLHNAGQSFPIVSSQ